MRPHRRAAQADEARCFGPFAESAVFRGTDATGCGTKAEFRALTFRAISRHLAVSPDGRTAGFD